MNAISTIQAFYVFYLFFCSASIRGGGSKLVVNVKNLGGEVFQEFIDADVDTNIIRLEVLQTDGNHLSQTIDFNNGVQIIKILILGEQDLNEYPYQEICFVNVFSQEDFIPVDAMAKLRQKNPWTVRIPERKLEKENITFNVLLDATTSSWISPQIPTVCSEAKESTFARKEELIDLLASRTNSKNNLQLPDKELRSNIDTHEMFMRSVKSYLQQNTLCSAVTDDISKPCFCELQFCIAWYPCALKYCRGNDLGGKPSSYRCGIHTCKRCREYSYTVTKKIMCMWMHP